MAGSSANDATTGRATFRISRLVLFCDMSISRRWPRSSIRCRSRSRSSVKLRLARNVLTDGNRGPAPTRIINNHGQMFTRVPPTSHPAEPSREVVTGSSATTSCQTPKRSQIPPASRVRLQGAVEALPQHR
jgi:hypothetical protein